MKKVTVTYYLYDELDESAKQRAIHNFKINGIYQYAYAWDDKKVIETIRKGKYYFGSWGEFPCDC